MAPRTGIMQQALGALPCGAAAEIPDGAAPMTVPAAFATSHPVRVAFGPATYASVPLAQTLYVAVPPAKPCSAVVSIAPGPSPADTEQPCADEQDGLWTETSPAIRRDAARSATVQRRMRRQRAACVLRDELDLRRGAAPRCPCPRRVTMQEASSEGDADDCARFMRDLEAGGNARAAAVDRLRGSVWQWSLHPAGCRVIQAALELCNGDAAASLAIELRGRVREAVESRHANFVIGKIVEVLPAEVSAFVAEELMGFSRAAVRHQYGCRIFCRLVEHANTHPATSRLIEREVAPWAAEHGRHEYAHYVVAHVLEHGSPQQQRLVVSALLHGRFLELAQNRYGRFVVEALFTYGGQDEQRSALALLRGSGNIIGLATHANGHVAIAAALRSRGGVLEEERYSLANELSKAAQRLVMDKYGQRVLQLVEKSRQS
mmetsp:Transcript_31088/g.90687  ORF Transcript_31088/g.90687 Transcript_31088/m.90687 type:complete len:433 (+) Transcript_31088:80-1378(+)|eukprot:CAMPEP_0170266890 /NCGR_PEP_ID=MMETSP0116_2-20130129/33366_1 /TAXON_ID=400756 /ORGANISM="Durinskia baltica, Strain CSIRO CS-38" /LENGTH=432 /DNA_ID=CAMNT_0010518035 /DNA_START=68 /DNA_END=1366 /DNA_ORIENTATION=+